MRAEDQFWITEQWNDLVNWLINLETENINNVVVIIVGIGDVVSYICKATILEMKEEIEISDIYKNKIEEEKMTKEEKLKRKNLETRNDKGKAKGKANSVESNAKKRNRETSIE